MKKAILIPLLLIISLTLSAQSTSFLRRIDSVGTANGVFTTAKQLKTRQQKVLPSFTPTTGTITAGDSVQRALEKAQGQITTTAIAMDIKIPYVADTAILKSFVRGNNVSVSLTDTARAGVFNWMATGVADGGITYPAAGGGYWVRQINGEINIKWFGSSGFGNTTQDGIAFSNAIKYLNNINPTHDPFSGIINYNKPVLIFPAGIYKLINPHGVISSGGLTVRGHGINSTYIQYTATVDTSVLFDIGTYYTNVTGHEYGGCGNFRMSDISIGCDSVAYHGQVIRDNGGGDIKLNSVNIQGYYNYGINLIDASDFDNFNDVRVKYCLNGVYFGPGSQQIVWIGGDISANKQGLIIEGANHFSFKGTSFGDNPNGCIVFEARAPGISRQLTNTGSIFYSYDLAADFDNIWLESATYPGTSLIPSSYLIFNNITGFTDVYRGINLNHTIITAGSHSGVNTSALVNLLSGTAQDIMIADVEFRGLLTYIVQGSGGNILIKNFHTSNGSTAPTYYSTTTSGSIIDEYNNIRTDPSPVSRTIYPLGSDNGLREQIDNVYGLRWAAKISGTWIERFGYDVQNRRLFLGALNSDVSLSRGSAAPSSGNYYVGALHLNTTASNGSNGAWINTSTGTPGTFIPAMFVGEYSGIASPNGSITAGYGARYTQVASGGSYLWIKGTGTGNTGWNLLFSNPMTNTGDIITATSGGTPSVLPIGTIGYVLKVNGSNTPAWQPLGDINNGAHNDVPTQTAAVTIIGTGSPGSSTYTVRSDQDHSFYVSGQLSIASITTDVIELRVDYTDEGGTARTQTFFPQGSIASGVSTAGPTNFNVCGEIRAQAGSAMKVYTVLTTSSGSISYKAHATIMEVN